jgi:hypothetical protein
MILLRTWVGIRMALGAQIVLKSGLSRQLIPKFGRRA